TVFEIAVTTEGLNEEERGQLIVKDDRPPPPPGKSGARGWQVLFRADDPSIWNTDSPDEKRFAIPVSQAHPKVRYLRLKRMDTGEAIIVPIRHGDLLQAKMEQGPFWNGTARDA